MRKLIYFAVFEPTENGYSVYFPDFPGCISFGNTFEEAQKEATDALSLHVYGMEKDGDALPVPSTNPIADPDTASGYILSPVVIFPDIIKNEMDNRKVKTNVTIPAWLKDLAETEGVNFSRILEAALLEYLDMEKKPKIQAQQILYRKDKDALPAAKK